MEELRILSEFHLTLYCLYVTSLFLVCSQAWNSWFLVSNLSVSAVSLCGHEFKSQAIIFIANMILLADLLFLQFLPF